MTESTVPPAVLGKLDELERRCARLAAEMNDPAAAADPRRIVRLAREHAQLRRLVEPYRDYRRLAGQIAEAEAILADPQGDGDLRALAAAELPELRARAQALLDGLIDGLVVGDDAAVDAVILEIRAGTGGDEAALFAGDLFALYARYAAAQGFQTETLDLSPSDLGGYREVIVAVRGPGVYTHFGYEGGGHRVQRVPVTEAQGRIHTSAATVAVLPEIEETEVNIDWEKDVREHVSRAGGPGGQNVNKVSSAIRLEHVPTGITVSMRDEKSQHKNRAKARRLLASRVRRHFDELERAQRDSTRRAMIGSGDRSERIRTYNFPQNRCTDHRVNANYALDRVLAGELGPILADLRRLDRQRRLQTL